MPAAAKRCAHCGHRLNNTVEVNVIGGIVLAVAVIVLLLIVVPKLI